MSTEALSYPESNAKDGAGGESGGRPPPTGGDGMPSGGFRGLLLRALARRYANVTGFVDTETALEIATVRRRFVDAALRDVSSYGVLEVPERVETPAADSVDPAGPEGAARQVVFEWQQGSPGRLLLARVCDAIDALSQSQQPRHEVIRDGHQVAVLMPLPRLVCRLAPSAFPWRVVVLATLQPGTLTDVLSDFREWFGVGVHVQRGRDLGRLRGCPHDGGRDGTVGGVVVMEDDNTTWTGSYGLTCGHVVGRQCPSVRVHSLPRRREWGPDAAVVRLDGTCLPAPPLQPELTPVDSDELQVLSEDHAAVSLHSARGDLRQGHLIGFTLSASDRDGPLRFPSVFLSRERTTYAGVPWPPFGRGFSKPGDSGAWVTLMAQPERWVAMVVSGDDRGHTIGHAAAPLLRWLHLVAPTGVLPELAQGGFPGPATENPPTRPPD